MLASTQGSQVHWRGPLALKTGTSTSLGHLLLEQRSPSRRQVSIL